MLSTNTIAKLQEMHLSAMARALKDQLETPSVRELSFEDRFGLIVDREYTSRKNNRLAKLIRQANFADTQACIEGIDYSADRHLDKNVMLKLASCQFIHDHHNIALLGSTGSGKTYIACALGLAAARNYLSVKYVRLPDLFTDLSIARGNGTFRKVIEQYKKPSLLILDEWLLFSLKETESRDLLEIAEARYRKGSIIFCSQFDVPGWREKITDPVLSEAICDRIVHDTYFLNIDCSESMRKKTGVHQITS